MALLVMGAMGHVGYEVVQRAAARGRPVVAQYRDTFREADARAVEGKAAWVRLHLADAPDRPHAHAWTSGRPAAAGGRRLRAHLGLEAGIASFSDWIRPNRGDAGSE